MANVAENRPLSVPIEKTLDEVREEVFAEIENQQKAGNLPTPLNLNQGGIFRGLVELFCFGLFKLYQLLVATLGQAFASSSTGKWLRLHCGQVNVEPNQATRARGKVAFIRESNLDSNVPIKKGRIVKTRPDGLGNIYRFITTEDVVLQSGNSEVLVAVQAEDYGQGANVAAGQICEIVTTIDGIDKVSNHADWLDLEGADAETEESLQERYVLTWKSLSGYSKYFYERVARSVAGVVDVKVIDDHPRGQGTVDIIIKGTAGVPTQSLLDKVIAAIEAEAPQNDEWLVKGATPYPIDIALQIEILSGDIDQAKQQAETRITTMFTQKANGITPFKIGDDFIIDRLTKVVMGVDQAKKINRELPTQDIEIPQHGLAVLGSLNVTAKLAAQA